MALKELLADLSIISKLGTNPGIDDGLSEEQLKAKFDESANLIKDYINNYLIVELGKIVDVEALLSDILDVTLSKSDKAANAAATGGVIRGLRSLYSNTLRVGDYVLASDGNFSAEILGELCVRIMGGEGIMQGNMFSLNVGSYEDINLESGAVGLNRSDLIVVRCTKGINDVLSYALTVLAGTNTSGDPVDPEYSKGDINADGIVHDFPLYRVVFNGYDFTLQPLFFAGDKYPFSAPASGWSDAAPYTQVVSIPGLAGRGKIKVYPLFGNDNDANIAMKEACGLISYTKRDGNNITFTCLEDKPSVDIDVILEVYV